MRLWRRPLGIACLRWGFSAEAGGDAATVVEIFHPGGDPGVDPVAGGEGTPLVILGFQRGPKGLGHGVTPAHSGPSHRHGSFHGAHKGGQLLGGELHSSISVEYTPWARPPRVVTAMSNAVMTRSVLCCPPMAYPRTRRECESRTAHRLPQPCAHRRAPTK